MRTFLFGVLCGVALFASALFAFGLAPTQTQLQLNATADAVLRSVTADMNAALATLRKKAASNSDALAKLDNAQSAWATYCDAYVAALWPSPTPQESYGSIYPMCVSIERKELTKRRISDLQKLLTYKEGQVCYGDWPD